jgi:hypothetical protein
MSSIEYSDNNYIDNNNDDYQLLETSFSPLSDSPTQQRIIKTSKKNYTGTRKIHKCVTDKLKRNYIR